MPTTGRVDIAAMDTGLDGIGHLLRDAPLAVPPFQRSYSWDTEQVEAFWQDLRAALVAEYPVYFLGTVVLSGGAIGRLTVIDGQQRLATTSMLFTAIRNAFRSRGDDERARVIEAQYVASTSLRSAELEPQILLNYSDREFYAQHVVSGNPLEPDEKYSESNVRIARAFETLSSNLEADVTSAGPRWSARLLDWVELLDLHARVIAVKVRDDADAFLIFETLNDRGLELTISDVIKNYLFGLARGDIGRAEELWVSSVRSLEQVVDASDVTTFLRQWWSSQNGATRERELYRSIRGGVQSSIRAFEILGEIEQAAPRYAATLAPEHDIWGSYPTRSRIAIESLLRFGLDQYRPLLLSAMEKFEPDELARMLVALVCWSARGLIVGGIGGGTTERYYAEAAVRVSKGRVTDTEGVMHELEPVVSSDEEFRSAFATRRIVKTRLARYYLIALDQAASGDEYAALVSAEEEQRFKTVYVLPTRNVPELWHNFFEPEDIPSWSTRLGNIVLAEEVASNAPLEPLPRLAAIPSDELVRGLGSSTRSWSEHNILKRQQALAALAVTTWPRRPVGN